MMLRHFSRDLLRRMPAWDAPVRLSFAIAILLLLLLLLLGFGGPREIQFPARVGAFGLLVTTQLLFLWGNRRDASPYHAAQKHFIAQDYRAARDVLKGMPQSGRASVDALVLLGNTYRNLGQFDKSHLALDRALGLNPSHHLALFSAGKLRLVAGEYAAASEFILRALEAGAPAVVKFELGQAYYLLGDIEKAKQHLADAQPDLADDPAQTLLLQYYLHIMLAGEMPANRLIRDNIEVFLQEILKYRCTPYGVHLTKVVDRLRHRLGDC